MIIVLRLLPLTFLPLLSGCRVPLASLPWVVASDWDDTIKAGGRGFDFGIRGVGQRVDGTYPGTTKMLQQLTTSSEQVDKRCFQIWSANPFSSKKTTSCTPNLHRKPVTRRGSILAGIGWVIANELPECLPNVRDAARRHGAKAMGDVKYRAFRRLAKEAGPGEVIFIGDSAQGDVDAARRMVTDRQHGSKAWVLIHDLTREVAPGQEPIFTDKRVAIKAPFRCGRSADRDIWRSERVLFYKTVPEAAFLLAQHGFLSQGSLQEIVTAAQQELEGRDFRCDEAVLERLRKEGRTCCRYQKLVEDDLKKCKALIGCRSFWSSEAPPGQLQAVTMEQLANARQVASVVHRSGVAQRRTCRSELYGLPWKEGKGE